MKKAVISKDYFNTAFDFEVEYKLEYNEVYHFGHPSIDKVFYNKQDVTLAFIGEVQVLVNETPECIEQYY